MGRFFEHSLILLRKYQKYVIGAFFALLLVVGAVNLDDFGISYHEYASRNRGGLSLLFLNHKLDYTLYAKEKANGLTSKYGNENEESVSDTSILIHPSRERGALFDMVLVVGEVISGAKDKQAIFKLKHAITFLYFWISLIFFFMMMRLRITTALAFAGVALLFLSPRIFAHAFYNMKDIAFLSAYIIAAFTMLMYLQKKTLVWGVLHGLACAISVDIRIPVVILPALTALLVLVDVYVTNFSNWKKSVVRLTLFGVSFSVFTILLWESPIENFSYAFTKLGRFPSEVLMYFRGDTILSAELPWFYIPVWIGITTPIVNLLLFMVGLSCVGNDFFRKKERGFKHEYLFALSLLFAPLLIINAKSSVLYNEWRHLYFIYPFFILVAVYGLQGIQSMLKLKFRKVETLFFLLLQAIIGSLALNVYRLHPFQYNYFNAIAGDKVDSRYDDDYWGLSYIQGLKFVVEDSNNREVLIHTPLTIGRSNADMLDYNQRERLEFVAFESAEYLMSTRGGYYSENILKKYNLLDFKEVFSLESDDIKLPSVFKRFENMKNKSISGDEKNQ